VRVRSAPDTGQPHRARTTGPSRRQRPGLRRARPRRRRARGRPRLWRTRRPLGARHLPRRQFRERLSRHTRRDKREVRVLLIKISHGRERGVCEPFQPGDAIPQRPFETWRARDFAAQVQQLDRAAVVARNSRPSFAEPIRSSRRGRRAESITGCPRARSAGVPHDTCTNFKVPRDRRRRSASIRVANRELVAGSGRAGGRISSQSSGCFKCFVITRVILPCPNLSCNVSPSSGRCPVPSR